MRGEKKAGEGKDNRPFILDEVHQGFLEFNHKDAVLGVLQGIQQPRVWAIDRIAEQVLALVGEGLASRLRGNHNGRGRLIRSAR